MTMFKYHYYCKQCGHYDEFETKEEKKLEKKNHSKNGCVLEFVPYKNDYVLVRPALVETMKVKRERWLQEEGKVDENEDSTAG
jgi:hypothetical protein